MFDNLKGYKTFLFAVLFILVTGAKLVGFADWQPSEDLMSAVSMGFGLLVILLRAVTNTPMFKKE